MIYQMVMMRIMQCQITRRPFYVILIIMVYHIMVLLNKEIFQVFAFVFFVP